jgi:hypothetical protein
MYFTTRNELPRLSIVFHAIICHGGGHVTFFFTLIFSSPSPTIIEVWKSSIAIVLQGVQA